MSICSLNISIGVLGTTTGNYITVKQKRLEGVYGRYLDPFLAGKSERFVFGDQKLVEFPN